MVSRFQDPRRCAKQGSRARGALAALAIAVTLKEPLPVSSDMEGSKVRYAFGVQNDETALHDMDA